MALRMIRQPSDTPNVSNIDDIVPFRYAYGDQNGYVVGKGRELGLDINGNILTLQTGRVVLNGVESDIEQNGVEITLDVVNETRYCVLYYRVNLGTNTTQILLEYSTAGYPDVLSRNDDLTKTPTGSANLELYRFVVNNGVVSDKQQMIKPIISYVDYVNNYINNKFKSENITKFGEYIYSKKKIIFDGDVSTTTTEVQDGVSIPTILNLINGRKYVVEGYVVSNWTNNTTRNYFITNTFIYNSNKFIYARDTSVSIFGTFSNGTSAFQGLAECGLSLSNTSIGISVYNPAWSGSGSNNISYDKFAKGLKIGITKIYEIIE